MLRVMDVLLDDFEVGSIEAIRQIPWRNRAVRVANFALFSSPLVLCSTASFRIFGRISYYKLCLLCLLVQYPWSDIEGEVVQVPSVKASSLA